MDFNYSANQLVISPRRYHYVDTIGGLLIIRVILLHCFQWAGLSDKILPVIEIFGFAMPWYFYKGGMFYRKHPISTIWFKLYHRLLIPFLVFSLIGSLFLVIDYALHDMLSWTRFIKSTLGGIIMEGAVQGNAPLWFLIALIFSRLLFNYLFNNSESIPWLVIVALWPIIAHYFIQPHCFIPRYLIYIASGTTFFALGYYFRGYYPNLRTSLLFILLYGILTYHYPLYVDMRSNEVMNDGIYLLWYPMSFIGIVGLNGIARFIFDYPNPLSFLGRNTMSCFCLHWIILIAVNIFYPESKMESHFLLITCYITANLVMIPVLTYIIKQSRFRILL